MLQIPQNYIHTRSTPFWNKQTAPAGIFERHLDKGTRPGGLPTPFRYAWGGQISRLR
ncbi:Uncharacterized protein/domain%2C possibly involved in tellurite resistance [Escherichia coli]|nr:Uncharacterized protein/domain%2C possibly involved in tellurite resistance [Escherichia coli]